MKNYNFVLNRLQEYNDDELFYREYYYAKNNPDTLKNFLSKHTCKEIIDRKLICPEIFEEDRSVIADFHYFNTEILQNIWVCKHNRYAPVFLHSHEHFEIFYVLTGSCTHFIHNKKTTLKKGTLFFIAPNVKHSIGVFDDSIILYIMIQKSTFYDIFFNILRAQNILSDFFLSNLYTTSKMPSICFNVNDDELVNLLLSMFSEETIEDTYTYSIINNIVSIFFTKLVRKYNQGEINSISENNIDKKALEILTYINTNYKTVSLEDVADHFNYTVSHCCRLIKSITGKNFTNLLRDVRLQRSQALLLSTNCSIEEISFLIGYGNSATFIKLFKQQYGMTPGQFRKNKKRKG